MDSHHIALAGRCQASALHEQHAHTSPDAGLGSDAGTAAAADSDDAAGTAATHRHDVHSDHTRQAATCTTTCLFRWYGTRLVSPELNPQSFCCSETCKAAAIAMASKRTAARSDVSKDQRTRWSPIHQFTNTLGHAWPVLLLYLRISVECDFTCHWQSRQAQRLGQTHVH